MALLWYDFSRIFRYLPFSKNPVYVRIISSRLSGMAAPIIAPRLTDAFRMVAAVATAVDRHTFDECTGRCRLPAKFMQENKLFNGSPVAVHVNGSTYLGKAHACRHRDAFAADTSISIAATHPLLEKLPKIRLEHVNGHGNEIFISIIPTAFKAAASVSLEPIPTKDADKAEINKLLENSISLRILQDACRRLVLHESCIVQLRHPHGATTSTTISFRVHRTLPVGLVRIVRATRVLLFQATDENSGDALATDVVQPTAVQPSSVPGADATTASIGGLHDELKKLEELIYMAVEYPNLERDMGIQLPKGVLLSGPPGVGKTLLVRTATARCQASGICQLMLRVINGAEILSGGIGDAEAALRTLFADGREFTKQSQTHVFCLFLDELDALCPRRDASGRAHSRIVAQLLTLMDGVDASQSRMLVFGATNLPNAIDPALRRPGRFDREVALRAPDVGDRVEIFKVHLKHVPLERPLTVHAVSTALADQCVGFVGADIAALCRQACMIALARIGTAGKTHTPQILKFLRNQQLSAMYWTNYTTHQPTLDLCHALAQLSVAPKTVVTMADFTDAIEFVQASSLRGANTIRKSKSTTWTDIGGLDAVKTSLQQAVEWPLAFPDSFSRLGLKPPRGILLYGPPGCSKSTIVRACACASHATFLSLSAAHVFSPFVGDAEAAIRQIFRDARAATPAIIFMDEIDAIVTKREFEQGGRGGSGMELRVLSTLLNEMDGVEAADGLLVIGATNRPDMIDAALLRPGRFDRVVYVPLPDESDRHKILQIHTKHAALAKDVDLMWLAHEADMFSGAELENVCREAALLALRDNIMATEIEMTHFQQALRSASPVSTNASLQVYKAFSSRQGPN
ncbi:hypothetical protein, variant [Aphanomyces invadans]|uniref:AAA+ ATPase domain-containing protein n=1 Tax=Aphanomyces invadans TaxID=157072 RepID=A0A024ULZ1_9STRA|nr:hypothetical protein, variant [Aphanomyces invadans]ETW06643.1 hypothetical protein, variant [Aphanomyces invadans]|eukprot:XP_008864718.1 hypothetical protein, variant [Aphanomyces invadans]